MPIDRMQTDLTSANGSVDLDAPAALDADGERAAGWLTESLSQPDTRTSLPTDVPPISKTSGGTMGDRILKGIQSVGEAYKEKTGELISTLNSGDSDTLSLAKVLRVQVEFATVSLQADVTTKGITKAPQQVDQLTHTQ